MFLAAAHGFLLSNVGGGPLQIGKIQVCLSIIKHIKVQHSDIYSHRKWTEKKQQTQSMCVKAHHSEFDFLLLFGEKCK